MPEPFFRRAVLFVSHPDLLWASAGGMRTLERQLFTAARADIKSVFIAAHEPDPKLLAGLRVPPELEMRWISRDEQAARECEPPYLGLSGDHLLRVETLAFIARQRFMTPAAYEDDAGLAVVQIVLRREDPVCRVRQLLPDGSYKRLEAPGASRSASRNATVDWLMAAGPKPQDGFMARHFDRHLSLSVSRALLDSPITPNQMTVFSTIVGLIGGACFLGSARAAYAAGALLVWLHSVLDGCDGELARVRFQESHFGSDLDFWGDNLVHLALFSCLGLGFWRTGNGPHTLVLAGIADAGVIASAWTAWKRRKARRDAGVRGPEAGVTDEPAGGGIESRLGRLENALAQRDFIYLLVLLALVDCVYEFLWAAAIGGSLYFAVMMYLRRVNDHEQARAPHPAG